MEKSLLVPNPIKPGGRPVSFIWSVFTTEMEPWKLKHTACMHCHEQVLYHRKSEYVVAHMKKCKAFEEYCHR